MSTFDKRFFTHTINELARRTGDCPVAQLFLSRDVSYFIEKVVEKTSERELGFDPASFSRAGNATCPFCGTVNDIDYVKAEGRAGRMDDQAVAVVAATEGSRGWVYLGGSDVLKSAIPSPNNIEERLNLLVAEIGIEPPNEHMG